MCCKLIRIQGFPMATRISLQRTCLKNFHILKSSSLPVGFCVKPRGSLSADVSCGFSPDGRNSFGFVKQPSFSVSSNLKLEEIGLVAKPESVKKRIKIRNAVNFSFCTMNKRDFSSLDARRVAEESSTVKAGNPLPWLSVNTSGGPKRFERGGRSSCRSSWEDSAKRLDKAGGDSIWVKSDDNIAESRMLKASQSSQSTSNRRDDRIGSVADRRSRYRTAGETKNHHPSRAGEQGRIAREDGERQQVEQEEEEEMEVVDDPRWSEIKNRFNRFVDVRDHGRDKPEYRKWNNQEAWGRKTWKEATESTIPKIVGEGIYGVGPVLAALSAGRREFYVLYVQEGLDLSKSNNRKKKDKKGFEKVLKIAEKIGLSIKEASKHDLNMVADNRPHQGLVLDASPLEMVKVKELDPVTSDEEKSSLWVALDEVTDPQNLGAIIRSAYFFGATGVVLCAKNSAPLSGVVSKASAGSLEIMELSYCKNMMQFLLSSAENGWRVIGGSVSSKAVPLNDVVPGTPTILVLGSEGTGLRPLVERSCTQLVKIDGNIPADVTAGESDDVEGKEFQSFLAVESLNVSVAAGVLLHHLIGNKQESLNSR